MVTRDNKSRWGRITVNDRKGNLKKMQTKGLKKGTKRKTK
jgi:hypothetical protein